MSSTVVTPRWARAARERKSLVVGLIVTLVLTVGYFAHGPAQEFLLSSCPSAPFCDLSNPSDTQDGLDPFLGPATSSEEDGFTLVIPTYRRLESLPRVLKHYAQGEIPSVRRVIILWNDVENDPPTNLMDSLAGYKIPVIVEQRHINSLNQRFHKSENIKTQCILSLDDDIILDPIDVQFGYERWLQYGQGRRRMLGYVARAVTEDTEYTWDLSTSYSMILTKAAFYHVDWMKAYWSETDPVMTRLRAYVDENSNCEDILMSFLHARYAKVPPLFFDAPFEDIGYQKGIGGKPGHREARTACVREFTKEFGADTLVSTDVVLTRMGR